MCEKTFDLSYLHDQIGDTAVVEEIVEKYFIHLEEQILKLRTLIPYNNHIEEIHRIAHSIRSGTENIGAIKMQEIAAKLEKEAKKQKVDNCGIWIEKLHEAFNSLRE